MWWFTVSVMTSSAFRASTSRSTHSTAPTTQSEYWQSVIYSEAVQNSSDLLCFFTLIQIYFSSFLLSFTSVIQTKQPQREVHLVAVLELSMKFVGLFLSQRFSHFDSSEHFKDFSYLLTFWPSVIMCFKFLDTFLSFVSAFDTCLYLFTPHTWFHLFKPVSVCSHLLEPVFLFTPLYSATCCSSVAALTECMRNKSLAKFFRERQASLKRSLPLGSYLLKPVQRILKYHLLLQVRHHTPGWHHCPLTWGQLEWSQRSIPQ